MPAEDSVFRGSFGTEITFTDQPITGWGGLAVVARFFEAMGIREVLEQALPDGRTSPNQVPVVDMATELLATILMGGRRFAHVERFRHDPVLSEIFGLERKASAMTITRYFGGFQSRAASRGGHRLWRR